MKYKLMYNIYTCISCMCMCKLCNLQQHPPAWEVVVCWLAQLVTLCHLGIVPALYKDEIKMYIA